MDTTGTKTNSLQSASGHSSDISPMQRKLQVSKNYYIYLVLILVLLSAQGSFVNDMYSPALPGMCKFFGCTVSLSQLGLTMGMIGLGIGQMLLGPISDKYGRKPVLIGATLLFIVAAVVSIFSPNIHVFNLCRLFQGLGASAGYFLAKTIPADVYSGRQLAKLMALVGAINGFAPASSPVIGGIMADNFGWKSIFLVLAGFATLLVLMSLMMKESLAPARRHAGSLLKSFGGYSVLLRNRHFMTHVILKAAALGLLFAYISSSPFIIQTHYGFSQTQYGLLIGLNALFLAAGSMVSLKFRPYKKAAFIGAIIAAAGVAALTASLYAIHNLWIYDICYIVILFACGMIFATSNPLAMNEGRAQAGEAAAVIGVAGYIIGATAAPLVGLGNIMHSTAIVNIVLTALLLVFAFIAKRIPADLNN